MTQNEKTAGEMICNHYCLSKDRLFAWSRKHNINLIELWNRLGKMYNGEFCDNFVAAILEDKPFK